METRKPTIAQLRLANPEFFHPMWERVFAGRTSILPGKSGWELIVDGKYNRPVYAIHPNTNQLTYLREEED